MTEYTFTGVRITELEFKVLDEMLKIQLDKMTNRALEALDDQVRLMDLRADYVWLQDEVEILFPLGMRTWVDEQLIRGYAKSTGCAHIVDALIDELSLKGAGIALALLDRSPA